MDFHVYSCLSFKNVRDGPQKKDLKALSYEEQLKIMGTFRLERAGEKT
jgi:hypothetical protein